MRPQTADANVTLALLFEPEHGFDQSLIEWLEQLQPLLALPLHRRSHRRGTQLLLSGFAKQVAPFR